MPIIEEYEAIARRMRELTRPLRKVEEIANLERWRDLAQETAQEYVKARRNGVVIGKPGLPRRF